MRRRLRLCFKSYHCRANVIMLSLRRLRRSLRLRGSSNGCPNLNWTSRGHFLLRSLSPPLICLAAQIHRHLNFRLGPGTSSAMIRTLLAVRALKALPESFVAKRSTRKKPKASWAGEMRGVQNASWDFHFERRAALFSSRTYFQDRRGLAN